MSFATCFWSAFADGLQKLVVSLTCEAATEPRRPDYQGESDKVVVLLSRTAADALTWLLPAGTLLR